MALIPCRAVLAEEYYDYYEESYDDYGYDDSYQDS